MQIVREDLAWAAGFYEGEGSCFFSTHKDNRSDSGQYYASIVLEVGQSGHELPEPLIRFQKAVGLYGKIGGPYAWKSKPNNLPIWRYRTTTFESAQAVVAMLWPWLSQRRRQQTKTALTEYLAFERNRLPLKKGPKPGPRPYSRKVTTPCK